MNLVNTYSSLVVNLLTIVFLLKNLYTIKV